MLYVEFRVLYEGTMLYVGFRVLYEGTMLYVGFILKVQTIYHELSCNVS